MGGRRRWREDKTATVATHRPVDGRTADERTAALRRDGYQGGIDPDGYPIDNVREWLTSQSHKG